MAAARAERRRREMKTNRVGGCDRREGFDTTGLVQGILFDQDERRKRAGLDVATDHIREKFGLQALRRAAVSSQDTRRET